ncbi:hypothetical protein EV363DRAFT_1457306 [Boletus edulis]|nr:hypothetical protein EV363DRAFT_1457306 [Boletus edulis]
MRAHTLALDNITGVSVAVVPKQGEPEFHMLGHRSEDGDEVTPETRFHMTSVLQAFCATFGLLMDDFCEWPSYGMTELTWHTRLQDVFPGDSEPESDVGAHWMCGRQRGANVKDILGHVSGVPRYDPAYGRVGYAAGYGAYGTRDS